MIAVMIGLVALVLSGLAECPFEDMGGRDVGKVVLMLLVLPLVVFTACSCLK